MLLFGRVTYDLMASYAEQGLIDENQIMVDPVAIGDGTPVFKGIKHKLDLTLTAARTFGSGVVLLSYRPASAASGKLG